MIDQLLRLPPDFTGIGEIPLEAVRISHLAEFGAPGGGL
jgi:hypothetical protein